jgi:cytochrome P450
MTTAFASITSDVDLFSEEALIDPYPLYRRLRDLGPASYLTNPGVWFLSRYDQVRAALTDWETYTSAAGPGLNPILNEAWSRNVIANDPPVHTKLRKALTDQLGPRRLKPVTETIDARAEQLADRLVAQRSFDAVTDLATDLPVNVIMDLIGWPESERANLLEFAAGSFDAAGPPNARMQAAMPKMAATVDYATAMYESGQLAPGSFGHTIRQMAHDGALTQDDAIGLLMAYAIASLDTTINAISNGMWLFATHPDQWRLLREDPSLLPAAFNEIIRIEGPVQCFARVTTRDVDLGEGITIPEGERVLQGYAAANRDERHYPDPDRFDITRNPMDHLGFGVGIHACVGQTLSRLEALAVFRALLHRVETIELAAEPVRALNNVTRGMASVPIRIS